MWRSAPSGERMRIEVVQFINTFGDRPFLVFIRIAMRTNEFVFLCVSVDPFALSYSINFENMRLLCGGSRPLLRIAPNSILSQRDDQYHRTVQRIHLIYLQVNRPWSTHMPQMAIQFTSIRCISTIPTDFLLDGGCCWFDRANCDYIRVGI